MKHKHYDMICAKAANMDLVKFYKTEEGMWNFTDLYQKTTQFREDKEYFLCLPKSKETCLHWLNGADVEYKTQLTPWTSYSPERQWSNGSVFMQDDYDFRIKPRKEKRWIGVNIDKNQTTGLFSSAIECEDNLNSIGEIYDNHPWQFIEIEVEVND